MYVGLSFKTLHNATHISKPGSADPNCTSLRNYNGMQRCPWMLVRPLLLPQKRRRHANTLAGRHQHTKIWHGAKRDDTGNSESAETAAGRTNDRSQGTMGDENSRDRQERCQYDQLYLKPTNRELQTLILRLKFYINSTIWGHKYGGKESVHDARCSEHLTTTGNTTRKGKIATGRGNTARHEDNEGRSETKMAHESNHVLYWTEYSWPTQRRRSGKNIQTHKSISLHDVVFFIASLKSNLCTALTTDNTQRKTVLSQSHKTWLHFSQMYF
jgi:hypothetical protein